MTARGDDKLKLAAENVILILVSRWSAVILVPIILGVGGWIVSSVQTLTVQVSNLQHQMTAQAELFDEKLATAEKSLTIRMGSVERRVDRLEYQQDALVRKTTQPPQ